MSHIGRAAACILLCLITPAPLLTVDSVVYNLRIAEPTRRSVQPEHTQASNVQSLAVALGFAQDRKYVTGYHSNAQGLLGTYLFSDSPSYYVRAVGAFAHVTETLFGPHASSVETDDIVLSGGYVHQTSPRSSFTLSGHLGIPTHRDHALFWAQFGTGHYALGFQGDFLYTYDPMQTCTIISAVRYLHFFPRNSRGVLIGAMQPGCWRVYPGDIIDLFVAHSSQRGAWQWELGYNPTFFVNGFVCPSLPVNPLPNIARSSFYGAVIYAFPVGSHPSGLSAGLSYGYDHVPRNVGFKHIVTGWLAWGVGF